MKVLSQILVVVLLVANGRCAVAAEDDPAAVKDKAQTERLEFMKAQAAGYRFTAGGASELSVVAEPKLRWTNPVSGLQDGTLFLWTEKTGRPAAAAQVFLTADNLWLHEFQSLSEGPFKPTDPFFITVYKQDS